MHNLSNDLKKRSPITLKHLGKRTHLFFLSIGYFLVTGCTSVNGYGQDYLFDPMSYQPYGGYSDPYYYDQIENHHETHKEGFSTPITSDQRELNYIYDHRREIARLPPEQQKAIMEEAERAASHNQ